MAGNSITPATGTGALLAGVTPPLRNSDPVRALRRLTDVDLIVPVQKPAFLSQVSNTLGDLGTPADGFDVIMAVPLGAFNDDVATLAGLDTHIADADFLDGATDTETFVPIANAIQVFNNAGDALLGGTVTAITPPGADAPPPAGGGAGGGGGAVGGGGAGGGGLGGAGAGSETCTLIVDTRTGEVTGTACTDTPPQGGGHHPPLQQ